MKCPLCREELGDVSPEYRLILINRARNEKRKRHLARTSQKNSVKRNYWNDYLKKISDEKLDDENKCNSKEKYKRKK